MTDDEPLSAELEQIKRSLDAAEAAVRDDAEERKRENEKRDNDIKWARRGAIVGLVAAVAGIGFGVRAQATANDIIDARKEGRKATCAGFEGMVNSLIASSEPSATQEERDRQVARIRSFELDFEHRLEALGCDLLLIQPPPVAGG